MTRIRRRAIAARPQETRELVIFAAGAALGALIGVLLSGRRAGLAVSDAPTPSEAAERAGMLSDSWRRIEEAWDGTMTGLAAIRDGWLNEDLDLEAVNALVHEIPGGGALEVRSLAPGILEIVGAAEADEVALAALQIVAEHPRVETVVNRIWTGGDPEATVVGTTLD